MFGRKKRKADYRIAALDASGAVLCEALSEDFQIPEAATLALSVEFFNDPQPCEIHRAAVRWRALQQLREAVPTGERVPVATLDASLRQLFPEGAQAVLLTEVPA